MLLIFPPFTLKTSEKQICDYYHFVKRLFAEGGNFTPKEIEQYKKHLKKTAKRIDSADEALMLQMEGTESKCLEQVVQTMGCGLLSDNATIRVLNQL